MRAPRFVPLIAAVVNVTATGPTQGGYLTVYPDGGPEPLASNLNFDAGQTVPNPVIATVGADGRVDIANRFGDVDIVADLAGYFID